MRSYSNFFQSISRLLVQVSQQSLSFCKQAYHPWTCTYVRLLGPCFKTGRREPFRQHKMSGWGAAAESQGFAQPPSPDTSRQSALESYQAHSPTRRQDTMSQEFSSSTNRCWPTRQETPLMPWSKQAAALALLQLTLTLTSSNLAKVTGSIRFPFRNFRHF